MRDSGTQETPGIAGTEAPSGHAQGGVGCSSRPDPRASVEVRPNPPEIGVFARRWFLRTEALSGLERLYVRSIGLPVLGLRMRIDWLGPLLSALHFTRALDAGSGRGVFAAWLAAANPRSQVIAVDADRCATARNRKTAAEFGIENLRFLAADLFSFEPEEPFDLIFSSHVLEHIENDFGLILRFRRMLAPGGRLLLHVPCPPPPRPSRGPIKPFPGHVRPGYESTILDDLVRGAGFRDVQIREIGTCADLLAARIGIAISGGVEGRRVLYGCALPFLLALRAIGNRLCPVPVGIALVLSATAPLEVPC